MREYLRIVREVMDQGIAKDDRTGTGVRSVSGMCFQHDMSTGFPLLTTKKVGYRLVTSELEFFISGRTDKQWLRDRDNHIWDEWANPQKAPYGHDMEAKTRMMEERDLGAIYGFQWRHFNAPYQGYDVDYSGKGDDQLTMLVQTLKTNPNDRRMIIMAWNPCQLSEMALPPCHYGFQVTVTGGRLNLLWMQRSVDVALGLPFNIASYATLLTLLALESGYTPGRLVGFLGDVHIYHNHIAGLEEQLTRDPDKHPLPQLKINNFKSIFDWQYTDAEIVGYESYPAIKFPIAV